MNLFRLLYTICYGLLIPFIIIRLFIKSIKLPLYRTRILERFGFYKIKKPQAIDIWIHAVSLGESIAASALIDCYLSKNNTILVTNMTPTGSNFIKNKYHNKIFNVYVPYDMPWIIKRFLKHFNIKKALIIETELWPNLIFLVHKHNIPLYLINARLSEKSLRGYSYIKWFMKPLLQAFTKILTQDATDRLRFISLGAKKNNTLNIGNIKYDQQITYKLNHIQNQLKKSWQQQNRLIIIAGSTHEPEEQMLLEAFWYLKQNIPEAVLLIAPRHPERFVKVYELARNFNNNVTLLSHVNPVSDNSEIIIIDSFGQLQAFYAISNYAFVGGSWSKTGGHNILEPIALNIPTFTGSNTWNFKAMINSFNKKHAITIVKNAHDLYNNILILKKNPEQQIAIINAAKYELLQHQGAIKRILELI